MLRFKSLIKLGNQEARSVAAQAKIPIAIGMLKQVFNTLGQCIKTYHTSENSLLLDGIQWQKGVYFISIKNENNNLIKKVIIN